MNKAILIGAAVAGLLGIGAVAVLLGCTARAPSGPAAADEAGVPRDPGQILAVGAKAPSFEAKDQAGNTVRLADFKDESNVVLIFYPGDDTPGCTKQLCTARDDYAQYKAKDAVVFGVNPADGASHQAFIDKYSFPFPLLADTDGTLTRDFGCRGTAGFATRTVYVIGKDGKILFAERGMPATSAILAAIP